MSTIRLWASDLVYLIAGESECPDPARSGEYLTVNVQGNGPLHHAVTQALNGNPDSLHTVTVDQADGTRVGGRILEIAVEDRLCECGANTITTTTIRALVTA